MNQFMGVLTDPLIDGRGDGAGPAPAAARMRPSGYASTQKPAAMRDAYAMFTKAAPADGNRSALERVGGGLWRLADHRRQCHARIEYRDLPHRRHRGRRRLSLLAFTIAGFALAGGGTSFCRQRLSAAVAPTCSRPERSCATMSGAGLCHRRARLWLAGHHHRSHRHRRRHRSSARASSTPTPGPAAPKAAIVSSRPGSAASASRLMPPPSSPPSICRPMPNRRLSGANTFALAYGCKERDRSAQRAWPAHRQILRGVERVLTLRGRFAWAHDYNPDRSIGATFQALPGASFVVNGARRPATPRSPPPPPKANGPTAGRSPAPSKASFPLSPAATPAKASCGMRGELTTSGFGTFRISSDVRFESAIRRIADMGRARSPTSIYGYTPTPRIHSLARRCVDIYSTLTSAALIIGHHFAISDFLPGAERLRGELDPAAASAVRGLRTSCAPPDRSSRRPPRR